MTLSPQVLWLIPVGFVAQMVDGCVGMGYGISASSILATLGIPPLITSATVHAAEVVTSGISSASHAWFRNLDRKIFLSLLAPGVVGGVVGATVLAHVPTHAIRPFVWSYLIITGLCVVGRVVFKRSPPLTVGAPGPALGLIAGCLDAIGGGGWGPIVTSTLVGIGHAPRFVIGSVNLTEFGVTVATSTTLVLSLTLTDLTPVIPLIIGGVLSAPFAGYLARIAPTRVLMTMVGLLILVLTMRSLIKLLG